LFVWSAFPKWINPKRNSIRSIFFPAHCNPSFDSYSKRVFS